MTYALLGLAAFGLSLMTLFSGFGLGTLLMPVFALIFPIPVAVAATAVVHGLNNLFKLTLLRRAVVPGLLLRFGVPAVLAAVPGALVLTHLSREGTVLRTTLGAWRIETTPLQLVMGLLILVFAVLEFLPDSRSPRLGGRWLPVGGVLSGFFGGLSGHQGALRAAFLGHLGLSPQAFAGTQAALGCLVDATRLVVYGTAFFLTPAAGLKGREAWGAVALATACAWVGAYLGKRLLPTVTVRSVRVLSGLLLVVVGVGLATGVF